MKEEEISLNEFFEIIEIKKKTTAAAFKNLKKGDIFKATLKINSSGDTIYIWKINEDGKFELLGKCIWSVFRRILTENYSLKVQKAANRNLIKDYCENYCLTGGDPEVCNICPLKKFK